MNSYFSHDSNARNSEELIKVRMNLGAEGYGVYFMILERMREDRNYMSIKDYNVIAFDLRVDSSVVKKVVENFGLFVFTEDGKYFYSESFLRRMSIKDDVSRKKSEAGKKGAAKRWGNKSKDANEDSYEMANGIKNNSTAMAEPQKSIASKVKESKVKKSKEINVPAGAEDQSSVSKNEYRYLEDSTEYKAAAYLRKKILEFNPKCKAPKEAVKDLQSWADTIRLTLERDERTIEELREVVKYIFQEPQGEFWRPNVQSPTGLRRNWDTIYGQMMQAKNTKSAKPKVKKTTFNSMQGREWDFEELARLENERLKRELSKMEGRQYDKSRAARENE